MARNDATAHANNQAPQCAATSNGSFDDSDSDDEDESPFYMSDDESQSNNPTWVTIKKRSAQKISVQAKNHNNDTNDNKSDDTSEHETQFQMSDDEL